MLLRLSVILFVVTALSATEDSYRSVRSLQPGAPNVNNKDQPWQVDPNLSRDGNGNTRADVNIQHHGDKHDVDAGWSKVIRGPGRAKPTWHVGGTYRWRRSLQPGAPNVNNKDQPWQVDPNLSRDGNGNTRADVNIQHHGDKHDVDAGWSKVIRGPGRAKPTWHVGGTYRWRRSLQPGAPDVNNKNQPWRLDPNLSRDGNGNTRADVNIQHHGDRHDMDAGWSKVIRGPDRAKPTWRVGGTYRWRRSLQPGAPNINTNKDQPWQLDPHVSRDDRGNTRTDVNIKHHGDDHDVEAGWSKVVRGPDRAKPTWHVGGSFRWRRSLESDVPSTEEADEIAEEYDDIESRTLREKRSSEGEEEEPWALNPTIERGDDDNTRADVILKHHGEDHDIEASWSKVVDGPDRAKPTWNVGGTFRW